MPKDRGQHFLTLSFEGKLRKGAFENDIFLKMCDITFDTMNYF